MTILFFGTPEFAIPSLETLHEKFGVTAVVTNPEKPKGRKKEFSPSPVKEYALQNNILSLEAPTLNDDAFFEKFKELKPDLCVVVAYGKIIPQKFLDIPQYGFINVHPSLLPKYRGPTPVQSAILNGDKETGVTIMLLDAEVDHGPILAQQEFSISNFKFSNSKELTESLFEIGARLLVETIPSWINSEITPKEQNHSQATLTHIFTRDEARIDWSDKTEHIYNKIRALNPEPGTWTEWNGKGLKILEAAPLSNTHDSATIGQVKSIDDKIVVKTADGYLELKRIQLAGKQPLDPLSFSAGNKFIGSVL